MTFQSDLLSELKILLIRSNHHQKAHRIVLFDINDEVCENFGAQNFPPNGNLGFLAVPFKSKLTCRSFCRLLYSLSKSINPLYSSPYQIQFESRRYTFYHSLLHVFGLVKTTIIPNE